jgi:uncharacterized iron-regulated protein
VGLLRARIAVLILVAHACVACAAPHPAGGPWVSAHGLDHPLVGRIWDVAAERFVDAVALVSRLARAPFVLLGEQHDNPDHHRLQARVVAALAAAGRRPAVAFEMLAPEQGPPLAAHLAAAPRDAAGLGEAVGWSRSGWPEWRLYQPIAEAALAAGLPLVPANLPAAAARALARGEPGTLDPALAAAYGLDRPLAPAVEAAMAAEIRESHCGHAPERLVPGMILAQRARDARMAESLLAAGAADGAVLITGNGHARADRGVPAALRRHRPGVAVASLAFLEVAPDGLTPPAYTARFGDRLPFDYVWFTPRADDEDPCEKFRQPLERLRRGRKGGQTPATLAAELR